MGTGNRLVRVYYNMGMCMTAYYNDIMAADMHASVHEGVCPGKGSLPALLDDLIIKFSKCSELFSYLTPHARV
jgi:hypothetical protein